MSKNQLLDLINYRGVTKIEKILSCFIPYPIISKFITYNLVFPETNLNTTEKQINIAQYNGNNQYVLKLKSYLEKYLKKELKGVFIHGSIGSYEEIKYSDFDALVIIKKEVFKNKLQLSRTIYYLSKAKRIMLQYDPLQHHGWFVLTEYDLEAYPQLYFPIELFSHSKILLGESEYLKVKILPNNEYNYLLPFQQLSTNIIQQATSFEKINNIFSLKSFLSEFMLLPTFYYQAKNNKAIYKKFSFIEIKKDIPPNIWSIMDEVSQIRETWDYDISWIKKKIIQKGCFLTHYFAKKYSPKIPKHISNKLDKNFFTRVIELTQYLQSNLERQNNDIYR